MLKKARLADNNLRAARNKAVGGFTIVELVIATAVFSVVLLVFLSAFLRISELFYKGINLSNTQETARNVIKTISDDVQFYHLPPSTPPGQPLVGQGYFCVGNNRYTYILGSQYVPNTANFGMVKESISGGCVAPSGCDY